MAKFVIEGGFPIGGELIPEGSKNAILPEISAALLTSEDVSLINIPQISDVRIMLKMLRKLGVSYKVSDRGASLLISAKDLKTFELDEELSKKIRASNLFLSSVVARCGKVKGWMPGGDKKIGLRDMSAHFDSFIQSGYKISNNEEGSFTIEKDQNFNKKDIDIFLYEPSVTATENAIMLNILGEGTVKINNAASEPHVRDLCIMLKNMGASIEGEGTNRIIIQKVESLHGCTHSIVKDHVYIGTFIIFSLMTGGDLIVKDIIKEDMMPILYALRRFSVRWEWLGNDLHIFGEQDLKINKDVYSNVGIYSQPWPMFPTDLLPVLVPLATQVEGETIIFEKMYSNRLIHTIELNAIGGNINLLDDYRVSVKGKTKFESGTLTVVDDTRTAVVYLAALLSASGKSTLKNVDYVYRGYPKIEKELTKLGAKIKKYESFI